LETLGNSLIKTKSNEEQNFPENQEVVIKLRELLVCFVSLTLGLFLSIIVFLLEILIFLKTHGFINSETKLIIKRRIRRIFKNLS
jgi:ABC-type glucose/galactose transport system permease subunit